MKKVLTIILICSCFAISGEVEAITVGPTVHFNFGESKMTIGVGLEAAYWTGNNANDRSALNGFDIGFEIQKTRRLVYIEYQRGYIFYGGSVGLVIQVEDQTITSGIQSSVWAAFFGGADLRFRYLLDGRMCLSNGLFAKLPIVLNDGGLGEMDLLGDGMM